MRHMQSVGLLGVVHATQLHSVSKSARCVYPGRKFSIICRSGWLGTSTVLASGAPVTGLDALPVLNQRWMLSRSYTCPSTVDTGSTMSSWEMGQKNCGGTNAEPLLPDEDEAAEERSSVCLASSAACCFTRSLASATSAGVHSSGAGLTGAAWNSRNRTTISCKTP
jgi:hypothetical protein